MKRILFLLMAIAATTMATYGSWYWPFGDDGDEKPKRISELMENATKLIDEASELAANVSSNTTQQAIAKYREALKELDRVEQENPDRAKSPEFATLRTKRAYVNAAIDSLLMSQVRDNARSVAVSDTTELEKRLAEEKASKKKAKTKSKDENKVEEKGDKEAKPEKPKKPLTKRQEAIQLIAKKEYDTAGLVIEAALKESPDDAAMLNLKAANEIADGRYRDAEKTLDETIEKCPHSHFAYYNMAELILNTYPDNKATARRYYETGRAVGGPIDNELEKRLK